MAIVGYVGVITEIEPGWGHRPDGYIIAKEKEDIDNYVRDTKCFNPRNSEYSVLDSKSFCQISELAEKEITNSESKVVWILGKDLDKYVLKS